MNQHAWAAKLRPWLALVRLPNLPTVPGDPLAGLVLAGAASGRPVGVWPALSVSLASLCLYMAGVVLNDLHDLPRDRVQRPERPLPAEAISPAAALGLFGALSVLGLLAALTAGRQAFFTALVLLGLIAAYNLVFKDDPARACVLMGCCRGVSMLLGAAAVGAAGKAIVPAVALAAAIAGVTALARGEDGVQRPGLGAFVPAAALLVGWLAVWFWRLSGAPPGWMLVSFTAGSAAAVMATLQSAALFGVAVPPRTMQAAIGRYIALLLPWQAAIAATAGTPGAGLVALILLALWPVSRWFGRWFAAS